ncbi:MAG: cyoE [Candidatus Kaiserbacteria bacterium]|nr:cyoE [Candidatus Kaiserbacteria bacterium]
MLKRYYHLAKPGIVYGNVFTTIAGYLYASHWHVSISHFLATVAGIALVIASAAVFNNYIDRDIDRKMARTRERALVAGTVSVKAALLYATVLGLAGAYLLWKYVNPVTLGVALFGFVFYVVIYGVGKRASHWGTVVGSVSGAVPIVVGYTAVVDRLDPQALILFLILALWQMPHFYAIAMYRLNDYIEAGISVLPAKKGMRITKIYIVCYVVAFIIAMVSLFFFGHAGYVYLAGVLVVGIWWLVRAVRGFYAQDDAAWARKFFLSSLIVLVSFSILLAVAGALQA